MKFNRLILPQLDKYKQKLATYANNKNKNKSTPLLIQR